MGFLCTIPPDLDPPEFPSHREVRDLKQRYRTGSLSSPSWWLFSLARGNCNFTCVLGKRPFFVSMELDDALAHATALEEALTSVKRYLCNGLCLIPSHILLPGR